MSSLKKLSITGYNFTAKGVKQLAKSTALEELKMDSISISDTVVEDLSKFKSLKKLVISRTKMTTSGAEKVKKALPDCQVGIYKR